jgi:hypothetical protein
MSDDPAKPADQHPPTEGQANPEEPQVTQPGPDTYYPQPDPPDTSTPSVDRTGPQGGRALDDADGIERRMRAPENRDIQRDPTLPRFDPLDGRTPDDPQVYPRNDAEPPPPTVEGQTAEATDAAATQTSDPLSTTDKSLDPAHASDAPLDTTGHPSDSGVHSSDAPSDAPQADENKPHE